MNVLRTWYLLLKTSWTRAVAALLLLLFVFMFFPAGWTATERIAAKTAYWDGFAARLGDPIFWGKALISLAAFSVLQAVFALFAYYFSLRAGSYGQRRR
jgi:hypothetical protein